MAEVLVGWLGPEEAEALRAENERYRKALERIAAGAQKSGGVNMFAYTWSRETARAALESEG